MAEELSGTMRLPGDVTVLWTQIEDSLWVAPLGSLAPHIDMSQWMQWRRYVSALREVGRGLISDADNQRRCGACGVLEIHDLRREGHEIVRAGERAAQRLIPSDLSL